MEGRLGTNALPLCCSGCGFALASSLGGGKMRAFAVAGNVLFIKNGIHRIGCVNHKTILLPPPTACSESTVDSSQHNMREYASEKRGWN